ncbi:Cyclin-dependent kinase 11B [Choanephora cucurbitarum]|uniref:cyclin-dependent kinase n=1 Tax=Choanephora cucurbitarum TaxID=101091 RepID=A0A1C7NIN5_9FUNG|nr:Cyclin-dependent kinase 11B [Choanephora cucurbitarum]
MSDIIKKSRWAVEEEDTKKQEKKRHEKKQKKSKSHIVATATASEAPPEIPSVPKILRAPKSQSYYPYLRQCRHVDTYERLNHIEEGSYGIVFRARDKETDEVVALKKLKLIPEKGGFPVTSLREIHALMTIKHPNIVNVREIVMGNHMDQVFIVMDFIEHDLKGLMQDMRQPFLLSETKTLMLQLLSAVALMHDNWYIHRDLKTSNLLLNNRGEIKVADFGLARKYGSPMGNMTQMVVTLWYRAPELLLGSKDYTTAIDMWSVGCIFAELLLNEALLPGRSEIDQLDRIFKLLGSPTEETWPGFSELPHAKNISPSYSPFSSLRSKFVNLTQAGLDLLSKLLTYDPSKRITAEEALNHPFFKESPAPKDPSLFPTWPSKNSGHKKRAFSPSAPAAAHGEVEDDLAGTIFGGQTESTGFRLKLA